MGIALVAAVPAYAQEQAQGQTPPEISADDLKAFVRARAADALGAADTAAAGYSIALADVPDDAVVAIRAYRQGLAAGDYALASRGAATLVRAGVAPPDTAILDFAVGLKARDRLVMDGALARMGSGPLQFMVPVLKAWLALDAKADPLALLDTRGGNALARRYAAEHRALLLIATGRSGEGLTALGPLLGSAGADGADLRIDAALLLAATGKRDAARTMLAGTQPELELLRKRLNRQAKPSAAFGAARLFLSLAVDLSGEEVTPLSILLTRAALLLDPGDDRARLYLAEALSKSGADRLALDVLDQVRRDSPFERGAKAGEIAVLRRAGRTAEAIARAKQLAEDRDSTVADAQNYGDLLAADDQFDAAAAAYGVAIARMGGNGGWLLNFLRGSALDRAGRWAEALPALRRAAELAPDEPMALTYLGFAQVEHQENLAEAQDLLERAQRLRPEDAAIADSLAWAYYLRGDAKRALPLLEQAARADPGGSLVNEHLGDVYWKLGRKYEARYAWRAAALYAGNDAASARIAAKLAGGSTAAD